MIIHTNKGQIMCNEAPYWSDYHNRWYVEGFKFIKSRQTFSRQGGLHNFTKWEQINEHVWTLYLFGAEQIK